MSGSLLQFSKCLFDFLQRRVEVLVEGRLAVTIIVELVWLVEKMYVGTVGEVGACYFLEEIRAVLVGTEGGLQDSILPLEVIEGLSGLRTTRMASAADSSSSK